MNTVIVSLIVECLLPAGMNATSLRAISAHKQEGSTSKGQRKLDLQKAMLPLNGKTVYLDLKGVKQLKTIEDDLKQLGAIIETFLSKDINYFVTNNAEVKDKNELQMSSTSGSPTMYIPSPFNGGYSTSPTTTNNKPALVTRGKAMVQCAKMNSKAESVLEKAKKWGVKIVPLANILKWISKEKLKYVNCCKTVKKEEKLWFKSSTRVKCFKEPFLKFECTNKQYRPIQQELTTWPYVCMESPVCLSPFDVWVKGRVHQSERKDTTIMCGWSVESKATQGTISQNKSRKKQTSVKQPTEELNLSRGGVILTAGEIKRQAEKRRREEKRSGYCECCELHFEDLKKHLCSADHVAYTQDESHYKQLDSLINQGSDLEQFLQKFTHTNPLEKVKSESSLPDMLLTPGHHGLTNVAEISSVSPWPVSSTTTLISEMCNFNPIPGGMQEFIYKATSKEKCSTAVSPVNCKTPSKSKTLILNKPSSSPVFNRHVRNPLRPLFFNTPNSSSSSGSSSITTFLVSLSDTLKDNLQKEQKFTPTSTVKNEDSCLQKIGGDCNSVVSLLAFQDQGFGRLPEKIIDTHHTEEKTANEEQTNFCEIGHVFNCVADSCSVSYVDGQYTVSEKNNQTVDLPSTQSDQILPRQIKSNTCGNLVYDGNAEKSPLSKHLSKKNFFSNHLICSTHKLYTKKKRDRFKLNEKCYFSDHSVKKIFSNENSQPFLGFSVQGALKNIDYYPSALSYNNVSEVILSECSDFKWVLDSLKERKRPRCIQNDPLYSTTTFNFNKNILGLFSTDLSLREKSGFSKHRRKFEDAHGKTCTKTSFCDSLWVSDKLVSSLEHNLCADAKVKNQILSAEPDQCFSKSFLGTGEMQNSDRIHISGNLENKQNKDTATDLFLGNPKQCVKRKLSLNMPLDNKSYSKKNIVSDKPVQGINAHVKMPTNADIETTLQCTIKHPENYIANSLVYSQPSKLTVKPRLLKKVSDIKKSFHLDYVKCRNTKKVKKIPLLKFKKKHYL